MGTPGEGSTLHSPLSPQLLGHGHGPQQSRRVGDRGPQPARPVWAHLSLPSSHPASGLWSQGSTGTAFGEVPPQLVSALEEAPPPGSLGLASGPHFLFPISQLCCNRGNAPPQRPELQEPADLGALRTSSMPILGARPQVGIRDRPSVLAQPPRGLVTPWGVTPHRLAHETQPMYPYC